MVDRLLTIVVVNYGTPYFTLSAISSAMQHLKETDLQEVKFLVVDNASPDESSSILEEYCKLYVHLDFFALDENLGFAGAHNYLNDYYDSKYILMLNPDTLMVNNAIDEVLRSAQNNPDNGIWGGVTYFGDGALNPGHAFRDISLWTLFCRSFYLAPMFKGNALLDPEFYPDWDRSTDKTVDVVQGSFLLIDSELWFRLKGFDLDFFMYGEEADLCFRAREIGARPLVSSNAKLIHFGGVSETVRSDKIVRLFSARCMFLKKNFKGFYLFFSLFLHSMWPLTRCLVFGIGSLFRKQHRDAFSSWCNVVQRWKEWLK